MFYVLDELVWVEYPTFPNSHRNPEGYVIKLAVKTGAGSSWNQEAKWVDAIIMYCTILYNTKFNLFYQDSFWILMLPYLLLRIYCTSI